MPPLSLRCLTIAAVILPASPAPAADELAAADEQLLRTLNLPVDGAGLVDFFKKRTLRDGDRPRIQALIRKLGDDDFDTREKATQELARLDGAEAALRKALEGNPSAEVRQRVQFALEAREKLELSAEWAVTLRALEVLEQCGTPEAREWLQALAKGAPQARLTQEAKACLRRLER